MNAARLLASLALAAFLVPGAAFADDTAVLARRVIYPGETVSAGMLERITLKPGRRHVAAIAEEIGDLAGKVASRTILPGRFIPLDSVREPYLVQAGAPVQAVFVSGALTISATAVPLEPGSVGDLVKLRNLDSGAVFTGVVMADGTIRVGAS